MARAQVTQKELLRAESLALQKQSIQQAEVERGGVIREEDEGAGKVM